MDIFCISMTSTQILEPYVFFRQTNQTTGKWYSWVFFNPIEFNNSWNFSPKCFLLMYFTNPANQINLLVLIYLGIHKIFLISQCMCFYLGSMNIVRHAYHLSRHNTTQLRTSFFSLRKNNDMRKPKEYKMKRNLEIPPRFKANSFVVLCSDMLCDMANAVNIDIGLMDLTKNILSITLFPLNLIGAWLLLIKTLKLFSPILRIFFMIKFCSCLSLPPIEWSCLPSVTRFHSTF